MNEALVGLKDLRTHFHTDRGVVRAVDGVDLVVKRNSTLGVVGESGCGKSVMALSIMGLIQRPPGRITGEIVYYRSGENTTDMAKLDPKGAEIRSIRGAEMSMVFQEPMTSLTPVYTIGNQIMEVIRLHQNATAAEARERALEMLSLVGIPAPERRIDEYPHQLSGGMRQRAMIAMALSCRPRLLIADEPTTALDVTVQAQILDLMGKLQDKLGMAIVLITHNLGVVAGMADDVAVMYLGQIVEYSSTRNVFEHRYHPYTSGLMNSIPVLGTGERKRLTPIDGVVPDPRFIPPGCRFFERCSQRMAKCASSPPQMIEYGTGHWVRCWLYGSERKDNA